MAKVALRKRAPSERIVTFRSSSSGIFSKALSTQALSCPSFFSSLHCSAATACERVTGMSRDQLLAKLRSNPSACATSGAKEHPNKLLPVP